MGINKQSVVAQHIVCGNKLSLVLVAKHKTIEMDTNFIKIFHSYFKFICIVTAIRGWLYVFHLYVEIISNVLKRCIIY